VIPAGAGEAFTVAELEAGRLRPGHLASWKMTPSV
jgi:hypothetical protein